MAEIFFLKERRKKGRRGERGEGKKGQRREEKGREGKGREGRNEGRGAGRKEILLCPITILIPSHHSNLWQQSTHDFYVAKSGGRSPSLAHFKSITFNRI